MRITEEQKGFLDQFSCERLTDSPTNQILIKDFFSYRGSGLVEYLKNNGWREDSTGEPAFYIIIGPDKKPWLYFSLQCGAMFELFNKDGVENELNQLKQLLSGEEVVSLSDKERANKIEGLRLRQRVLVNYNRDIHREGGRPIHRVGKTYPCIEIVQFCADDNKKKQWKDYCGKYNIHYTMGQVMFWKFAVKKLEAIQKMIGCQFAFLFAADITSDETLLNYYEVSLKFVRPGERFGISKPVYDYACVFMSQEIRTLIEYRKRFFNTFNIDEDEDVV